MTDERRSAQDLVRFLRGRGVTNAEIAAELDRSPRMVTKILNGETRGDLYRATLEELASTGRATTVPPRRRTKSGELVKVRATTGGEEKSVTPVDTGGTYAEKRQGGRFTKATTYLSGGARQIEMKIPKGKAAKGRLDADEEIVAKVRAAAKGQARDKQKQVSALVTYGNGRTMQLNNYNASTMLQRIREAGGSPLEWMRNESGLRYSNLDVSKEPITGVTLTVMEAPKTTAYRRQADRGRERTSRELTPAEKAIQAVQSTRKRGGRA